MGFNDVAVPKQYVLVQDETPSGQFQGQIWYKPDTANTYIYQAEAWRLITIDPSGEFSFIENEITTHELNIIELRAITESTPIDAETLLSDTFNKASGIKESVNTTNTTALFNISNYTIGANNLETGLVAYYKYDETSGTTATSQKSYNGTASNARVFTSQEQGIINTGADFTQGNDYISNGSAYGFTNSVSYSFQAWFKFPTAPTSGNTFTIHGIEFPTAQYSNLGYKNDGGTLKMTWDGHGNINYTTTLTPNVWHHVIITLDVADGNKTAMYLNGELVGNATKGTAGGSGSALARVGDNAGGTSCFNGIIDEVAVWNRPITLAEAKFLFNNRNAFEYSNFGTDATMDTKLLELDLPTITGEVTHTQLIINGEIETGASITYKLNDGTTDSAETEINTKNTYTLTGIPTKLKVYLNPKETSPTMGNPTIKTYCLKLWKA
jgi:hypothetical protein